MNCREMLSSLIENEDCGVIFVDKDGIIRAINEMAKRIMGITLDETYYNSAGRLEKGDIVIIADSQIGEDDGELEPRDLKKIGVNEKYLRSGDTFVGMGVYRTGSRPPRYKFSGGGTGSSALSISENYGGREISAYVDFGEKKVGISVDGKQFTNAFISSYGHMVVLDGKTGDVKFIQANGYSIRKESIRSLLDGATFKDKDSEANNVIGEDMRDLFADEEFHKNLSYSLSAQRPKISDELLDLSKRTLLISMFTVFNEGKEPGVAGSIIKLRDISSIDAAIESRDRIIRVLEKKHKELMVRRNGPDMRFFDDFIGNSAEVRRAKSLAMRAARLSCNVLILGESGTGKSLLAKEIYKASHSGGPFVYADCSIIAPNLFESEMFGYVGGAFTGSDPRGRAGFFETANNGTIFLDEIGELPIAMQVKLLNTIQNKEIYRVGSPKPIPVNVRIIAATNKDLEAEVARGAFRTDLYYRLNVFSITLPPLRNCRDDIYFLSNSFLDKACRENGLEKKSISNEAFVKLVSYDWPGNVRELRNVIERAAVLCDGRIIYEEYIDIEVPENKGSLREIMKSVEKNILIEALRRNKNNKKAAMEQLGVSRSVFYTKLREYGIK